MTSQQMNTYLNHTLQMLKLNVTEYKKYLQTGISQNITQYRNYLQNRSEKMNLLDPQAILSRGYAIVYRQKLIIRRASEFGKQDLINVQFSDGSIEATVNKVITP
jgi:exodeoxyribonuclease VII large subunit